MLARVRVCMRVAVQACERAGMRPWESSCGLRVTARVRSCVFVRVFVRACVCARASVRVCVRILMSIFAHGHVRACVCTVCKCACRNQ